MPSDKIKSKDLSVDKSLPPFLQRLQEKQAGRGDRDRHEQPLARPKRAKANDEEDEPTVVDETGETISKEDLEKLASKAKADDSPPEGDQNITGTLKGDGEPKASGALLDDDDVKRVGQKVTDGTTSKKRKAAKVVGIEAEAETSARDDEAMAETPVKKAKKKAKPIQLAFNDDEEG